MKKLMIAAAIAFAAVASQAADVKWNLGSQLMNGWDDGKSGQAGTVFIYNLNVEGVTRQAVLDAFIADGTLGSVASMGNYATDDGTMGKMKAKKLGTNTTFTPVRTSEDDVKYADFFYAMVVTDTDKNKHLYISEAFEVGISTTQTSYLAGDASAGSMLNLGELDKVAATGGWYAQSVPEPTSGLLLLLGVAGLALRRRRA